MKKKNKYGQYLKEISTEFIITKKITPDIGKKFVLNLIDKIDMTLVSLHINRFDNGGFDILAGIKESHIVFSYWIEHNYIRISCSSCKEFDNDLIDKYIRRFFKLKELIINTLEDCSIKQKIENICLLKKL